MTSRLFGAFILGLAFTVTGNAQIVPFSQDFNGMDIDSADALADDNWQVFGNVFDGASNYLYGYGPFVAPNSTADGEFAGFRFSLLTTGEGGGNADGNHLVTLSDYNNTDHQNPDRVLEALVFRESIVGVDNVGETWVFKFDANVRDLASPSTSYAFLKTLDPANGFATTTEVRQPTTNVAAWTSFELSIVIDAGLVGQILQVGFSNTTSEYNPSGVLYDNVSLTLPEPTIVTPESVFIAQGTYVSGDLAELAESDDIDYVLRRNPASFQPNIFLEANSTSPTATPDSITFIYEAAVVARSSPTQSIDLWNYVTGTWEEVDSRAAARFNDATTEVVIDSNADRFVDPANNQLRARIRLLGTNPRQSYTSRVDLISWTIE